MSLFTTANKEQHFIQTFERNVFQKAGSADRSMLREMIDFMTASGESVAIDSVDTGMPAATSFADLDIGGAGKAYESLKNKYKKKDFETVAQGAGFATAAAELEARRKMETPFHEIERERTLAFPGLVEWAHWFDEDEDIFELSSPVSKTLEQGMRKIWRDQDAAVITALAKAAVPRRKYLETSGVADTAFPADQIIDDVETEGAAFSTRHISAIMKKFEENYVLTDKVFILIHPLHKQQIIDEQGKQILSRDFVNSYDFFMGRPLPDIYGAHLVVHPLAPQDRVIAWVKRGVRWVQFKPLHVTSGTLPQYRFHNVLYVREKASAVRVDDKLVVWCDLVAPSGGGS